MLLSNSKGQTHTTEATVVQGPWISMWTGLRDQTTDADISGQPSQQQPEPRVYNKVTNKIAQWIHFIGKKYPDQLNGQLNW